MQKTTSYLVFSLMVPLNGARVFLHLSESSCRRLSVSASRIRQIFLKLLILLRKNCLQASQHCRKVRLIKRKASLSLKMK